MAYYNRKGKLLNLEEIELSRLDSGNCGSIDYNDDMIFKKYHSFAGSFYRLKPEMFDFFKTVNNPHFIEFYEIYCEMNPQQLSQYLSGDYSFRVDAYTAKYYPDNSIKVLFEKKDYLLDNFREIEKLFNEFANDGVIVNDLKRDNVLLSKDGIIIIDPDSYYFSDEKTSTIAIENKRELLYLFKSICLTEAPIIVRNHFYTVNMIDIEKKIYDFGTKIRINKNTDVTYEISKKLEKVKRPVKYFL